MKKVFVTNLKGEKEPFSAEKVYKSAKRAGASSALAKEISQEIKKIVYPGIQTREIFLRVKQLLRRKDKKASYRFDLKRAMAKMGPSGFPFEKFIGEIFSFNGFKTKLNQSIKGKYAIHEVDFVAKKNDFLYIGECKFRHHRGERIDLSVILAFSAKFQDIEKGNHFKGSDTKAVIVTNAKFSSQAKNYAKGMDIELLGWNYPKNKGLEKLIEQHQLYPITILPSFKGFLIDVFSKRRTMLARDILQTDLISLAKNLNIREKKLLPIVQEAKILFGRTE